MTKQIPLNKGRVATVDDEDYERISRFRWSSGCSGKHWYAIRAEGWPNRKTIYLHRQILNAPAGTEVDHINGDTLDNRRENLRLATRAQNNQNRGARAGSSSGYKGVSWNPDKGRWAAEIVANGKRTKLGCFADPKDAARAYDAAARQLHGEFAKTNF
jgi:hypothetical protein